MLDHNGEQYWLISFWTYGRLNVLFQQMATKPPFDDEALRVDLLRRVNDILDVNLPPDGINRLPAFPIAVLKTGTRLEQFLGVLDWIVEQVKLA